MSLCWQEGCGDIIYGVCQFLWFSVPDYGIRTRCIQWALMSWYERALIQQQRQPLLTCDLLPGNNIANAIMKVQTSDYGKMEKVNLFPKRRSVKRLWRSTVMLWVEMRESKKLHFDTWTACHRARGHLLGMRPRVGTQRPLPPNIIFSNLPKVIAFNLTTSLFFLPTPGQVQVCRLSRRNPTDQMPFTCSNIPF